MEMVLVVAVLCLSGGLATLAASVPFLYWRCFRMDARLAEEVKELQKQIDTLDEALARLLEGVGVPTEEK